MTHPTAAPEGHLQDALLATVPDAVLVVDDRARITGWNPAAERLFGFSREQVLGLPVTELVPPEEQRAFAEVWDQLAAGDQVPPYETGRLARDGSRRRVSVHVGGYRERGAFAGAVAAFRELAEPGPASERDRVEQLRVALAGGELRLHYQPIVAIADREPVALEALVRWDHPTEGLLLPAAFVPAAERSGLVHDLGRWVATTACRQAVALSQAGTPVQVALNVSARQLVEHRLADLLEEVVDGTGCPPSAITVEVTETAVMADLDVAAGVLRQLTALGVGVALDDFGTGYSSLLYLRRFPVDTLKIDRSFVAGLGTSPEDTAIVASTVSLAHSVGVRCVAEGVETLVQLELLQSMGCDLAQGYLFSRALTPEQLDPWLTENAGGSPRAPLWSAAPPPEAGEILRMHGEGASLHTIAAALNATGRRTARGTRWRAQTVATVVASWAYPSLGG